jgi:hypothetical protein
VSEASSLSPAQAVEGTTKRIKTADTRETLEKVLPGTVVILGLILHLLSSDEKGTYQVVGKLIDQEDQSYTKNPTHEEDEGNLRG